MIRNVTMLLIAASSESPIARPAPRTVQSPLIPMKSETCILPANPPYMSLCWVFSSAPAGVILETTLDICPASGLMKRSMKGACISISSSVRGRTMTRSSRSAMGSFLAGIAAPTTAKSTPKKARKPAIAGIAGLRACNICFSLSDLNVDDLANKEEASENHNKATPGHRPPTPCGFGKDAQHVARVDDAQQQRQGDGQHRDDVPGILLLRGEHFDFTDQLDAVANRRRDGIEYFDEVAADFTLHIDRRDQQLQVLRLHTLDKIRQRFFWRQTQTYFAHDPIELGRNRLGRLTRDKLHGLKETVAGSK